MDVLSPVHLLIIAVVFVLLFGAKRLPDGARSLGRSMRIFKSELRGMHEDDQAAKQSDHVPAPLPVAQPIQAQPIQAQPIQAQPIQAQPVQAQPVQAQPVEQPTTVSSSAGPSTTAS